MRGPHKTKPKDRNYEVGRGKPPKEHQFSLGTSGNPAGPKVGSRRSRSFDDILNERVTVKVKGKPTRMSRREVGYRQLGRKIEEGDHRATQIMIEHDRRKDAGEPNPDPFTFDPELRRATLGKYEDEVAERATRRSKSTSKKRRRSGTKH